MKIKASVGNAPRTATLEDEIYSIDLRAETHGERQLLAGLLPELSKMARKAILSRGPPRVIIRVESNSRNSDPEGFTPEPGRSDDLL